MSVKARARVFPNRAFKVRARSSCNLTNSVMVMCSKASRMTFTPIHSQTARPPAADDPQVLPYFPGCTRSSAPPKNIR